ncbi:MAG: hypothetical protein ACRD3V_11885 [Vicinamibacteria bacterium]
MTVLLRDKDLRERRDLTQQVKRAILESPASDHPSKIEREARRHEDREALRGIPVLGRRDGLGSVVRGTQPEAATLRKLGREEARRKRMELGE